MSSRLTRVSAVVVVAGAALEAAAAALAVTPQAARYSTYSWVPFVVAVLALCAAGTRLGNRAAAALILGLVAVLSIGAGMAVLPLAGAGVVFAAALVAGEASAGAVYVAGGGEGVAAGVSLFAAALAVALFAAFGERLDVPVSIAGECVGGVVALVQLAGARYADGAVALRFRSDDVIQAATARLTETPRRIILAVLGATAAEG